MKKMFTNKHLLMRYKAKRKIMIVKHQKNIKNNAFYAKNSQKHKNILHFFIIML